MTPAAFVFLPVFPLTINGKLDRAALPAPGTERPQLAADYIEPGNDLEKSIAQMWRSILHRDAVGTEDNFFDLGGDSLLLTQMHRELESQLKRQIPITDLFQFPTIRLLAAHLSSQETAPASGAAQAHDRAQRQREALLRARRPIMARKQLSKKVP
jgi:acyl carrier protein